ncbi:thiol-disulfide oxidoreductase DCC family protein [Pilimelia anulata]|uniref:thiol-disulfide oxidoreductase DCC family protein n=1 Tax=Pilimelia anulata TaxID=53371 RepID=UPI001E5DAE1F|nr:DCC1-like thiol-disulfide oxidoreductase family protein [Pilimelia anulata]
MITPDPPVLVYDGDCGFCTRCAAFLRARVRPRAALVPSRAIDPAAYGLTAEQCAAAVQWCGPDGERAAGPVALARLLQRGNAAWRAVGTVLALRPVAALAWPPYRLIARHRHRLPGSDGTCGLPSATGRLRGVDPPDAST